MQSNEAIQLINIAEIDQSNPQVWADLGAGSGTFTRALASLLPPKSTVYAVDKVRQFSKINFPLVTIIFQQADFEKEDLLFKNLDGILLANSLHYVEHAPVLIDRLSGYLKEGIGKFIIVEYDTVLPNQWVPYPLPFLSLKELFAAQGFSRVRRLGEKKSLYQQGNLYACEVMR
jgi:ubiquinone/menaquinone biosynthesis C-methylase UbiE